MSCGRRAFWPAMRANMGRRPGVIAFLAQGAVCKILGAQAIKPRKARCYLQRRDPECEVKMAQILCIYKKVEILKAAAARRLRRAGGKQSSRPTRSLACRRLARPPRTWPRNRAFTRLSPAIMHISDRER